MLQVNHLQKTYVDRKVVDDVSFTVEPGQIIGLLGPNGAGKTTTVSMICGLTPPDAGQVLLAGEPLRGDASPVKSRLGLVPQDLALFEQLPAIANVTTFGALYGLSGEMLRQRALAALALVGLAERARDKPANFSGGMKRRLNIACALVHDPDILLLDEPTVGIDPQSRNAIFDNLEALKAAGKALVYTTHYMEEAERLCDRIVIMDHGKVIANDTLAGIYRLVPAANRLRIETASRVDVAALCKVDGVQTANQEGRELDVGLRSLDDAGAVLTWVSQHGHAIENVQSGRISLESLFLSLTGHQLRDPS